MFEQDRISAAKLKPHHFEKVPVWAYCLDEEGEHGVHESCLRPACISDIATASYGQFLVAATYTLANKNTFPGAVQIDSLGSKVVVDPAFLFLLDRQLEPISVETERLLSRYTKFPGNSAKKWELKLTLPGESKLRVGRIRKTFGFHLAALVLRLGMSVLKRRL